MRFFSHLLASLICAMMFGQSVKAAPIDPQFDAFWTKFKAAVAKRDKQAVAAMTKLPFLFESKMINKQQFLAKFDQVLPKNTAACFKKEKPVADRDNTYDVFCGETIYLFNKVNGKWMFAEIGVND